MEHFSETKHHQIFIHGEWADSANSGRIEVENPATEEIVATVPEGSAEDAQHALESAQTAQPDWAALPAIDRAKFILALASLVGQNRETLARLVVSEQGKPLSQAYGEVDATVQFLTYAAEGARRIEGDIVPADNADEEIWIRRVPFGVTVGLIAWNYPLALVARKIGPSLVAGNTIVLKSHEGAPLSGLMMAKLAQEAGFPPGTLNVVTGTGRTVGDALVRSPITQLVTMTGSVRGGREIFRAAAENITVVRLELGGKAPFIVMDDADIDEVVQLAAMARFANCGQVCTCNERMYIHEKIADQFVDKFLTYASSLEVGDPLTDVDIGPKFNRIELEKVEALVENAVANGAELLSGGKRLTGGMYSKGYWFPPTALTIQSNRMEIMQKEVFGPVIPIMKISDFEQGLQFANESDYGLAAYVFTKNINQIMRLARDLKFGEIYINRSIGESIQGYHSGYRLSGVGGEDGKYGLDGYLQKKTIYVNFATP
ncbi:MAG: aldehyde dehydrogenase [Dehalococcoidales bacterium]|nr:aldehyde dehydrogenase [Dehalococcoidales bacterium]